MTLQQIYVSDHHVIIFPRIIENQQDAEVQVVKVGLLDIADKGGNDTGVSLIDLLDVVFKADLRIVGWIRLIEDLSIYVLRAIVKPVCGGDGGGKC